MSPTAHFNSVVIFYVGRPDFHIHENNDEFKYEKRKKLLVLTVHSKRKSTIKITTKKCKPTYYTINYMQVLINCYPAYM